MRSRQGERLLLHRGEAGYRTNTSPFTYRDALARGNIYRFFSSVFLSPPKDNFLQIILDKNFLEELSVVFGDNAVADLKKFAVTTDLSQDSASLKQEYMDLFAIPAGSYVTPFEDVYGGRMVDGRLERGRLLGERAIAVIRMYREAGAEMKGSCKELPTHIGVELSFMGLLCEREALAIRDDADTTASRRYRELQLKFLQGHLNEWFPQLSEAIQANARSYFYRGLAQVIEVFLAEDTAGLFEQLHS